MTGRQLTCARELLYGEHLVLGEPELPGQRGALARVGQCLAISAWWAESLAALGAEPIVCDVFDGAALTAAARAFEPEMVMHQLTDLPDDADRMADYAARNDRMRSEGTRNLIVAARAAGAPRLLAQSIAWRPPGRGEGIEQHEHQVLDAAGLVVRYGRLYGPGTFYEHETPGDPQVHVAAAARATVELLDAPTGLVVVSEDEHGDVRPLRLAAGSGATA